MRTTAQCRGWSRKAKGSRRSSLEAARCCACASRTAATALPALIADCRPEFNEILFVLEACVIEDIVTDLAPENFLRRERLHEIHRIVVGHDELECIGIG